jgi:hypothetical protein
MGEALTAATVAHADETGICIASKLHCLPVLVTALLTWLGAHPKRGKPAFDAFGVLIAFTGTLIHDGWKPYREVPCKHGLCNALVVPQPCNRDSFQPHRLSLAITGALASQHRFDHHGQHLATRHYCWNRLI